MLNESNNQSEQYNQLNQNISIDRFNQNQSDSEDGDRKLDDEIPSYSLPNKNAFENQNTNIKIMGNNERYLKEEIISKYYY